MSQVHGERVVEAGGPREQCDGIVTDRADVVLLVRVADCVPVLLADPVAGVVGVAHAGRAGVVLGVVERAVERLTDLGAGTLTAWVGPHVCAGCYEVPAALRVEAQLRAARPSRKQGAWQMFHRC